MSGRRRRQPAGGPSLSPTSSAGARRRCSDSTAAPPNSARVSLDAALRVQTRLELAKMHQDIGTASMLYVTHDQVEAMTLASKIALLNAGPAVRRDGSVAQYGAPLEPAANW